ncbi:Os02g0460300 [Oryza sativa Japonica Group]|uniref:Os02g0460300 protein n=2 Tax=Oryza sativa subsp. japonica TaxID=39947 RepID=A3A6K3_ORYSJ|nr:hypothetical protein OsJ_06630 [Oryza sativa Japonica Group]BAS78545.1 Os02g0460300 [Oryza sativa Japonica Group]
MGMTGTGSGGEVASQEALAAGEWHWSLDVLALAIRETASQEALAAGGEAASRHCGGGVARVRRRDGDWPVRHACTSGLWRSGGADARESGRRAGIRQWGIRIRSTLNINGLDGLAY